MAIVFIIIIIVIRERKRSEQAKVSKNYRIFLKFRK